MPFVLVLLIGLVLALIAWGLIRHQRHHDSSSWLQDDFLAGAVILAAFALGVFLTYSLVFINSR